MVIEKEFGIGSGEYRKRPPGEDGQTKAPKKKKPTVAAPVVPVVSST
jgi:hypothetical protein